jgi:hypothetical protein
MVIKFLFSKLILQNNFFFILKYKFFNFLDYVKLILNYTLKIFLFNRDENKLK